ncbi:MAG: hypothetical protein HKP58_05280, partial [Desulfatitalea sp.]|nr:hypothetical protein [Desulfatitalea sp.]NNJ99806.1 hypothetical protein [Desulfatitalea sp.]
MHATLHSRVSSALPALSGVATQAFTWTAPFETLAARFAHLPGTVVLRSGGQLDCAHYNLMGVFPWLTLRGRPGRVHLTVDGNETRLDDGCLAVLRAVLAGLRLPPGSWPPPV